MAVAYVSAAGGIIQLASAVFPAWELPNWALRLTVLLLLLGFPIALILAWAFDVTPQGIRTTPKLESALSSHRRRNMAILLVAGLLDLDRQVRGEGLARFAWRSLPDGVGPPPSRTPFGVDARGFDLLESHP